MLYVLSNKKSLYSYSKGITACKLLNDVYMRVAPAAQQTFSTDLKACRQ